MQRKKKWKVTLPQNFIAIHSAAAPEEKVEAASLPVTVTKKSNNNNKRKVSSASHRRWASNNGQQQNSKQFEAFKCATRRLEPPTRLAPQVQLSLNSR